VTLLRSARHPAGAFDPKDLKALAAFVFAQEGVTAPIALAVDLMGHERIRTLNRRYLGLDQTTDVISFRDDLPAEPRPERYRAQSRRYWEVSLPAAGQLLQGDIAINVEQALAQARKAGHPLAREVRLLLIHGLLHLLGYTDYDSLPRRKMFARQGALLRRWERLKRV
jgi:probable rRNA maturation factor